MQHDNAKNPWLLNCKSLFRTLNDKTLEPMTISQLLAVLATYDITDMTQDELTRYVRLHNHDGTGRLSILDFVCIMNHIANDRAKDPQNPDVSHIPRDEVAWAYDVFAKDDGVLTIGELEAALTRPTSLFPNGISAKNVALLLATNGLSADATGQRITREEFVRICLPPPTEAEA